MLRWTGICRFFDNREKYLLFASTCNEKQVIAEWVAMERTYSLEGFFHTAHKPAKANGFLVIKK